MKFYIDYPPNFGKLYGLNAIYAGIPWQKRRRNALCWHDMVLLTLKKSGVRKGLYKYPVRLTFYWNDRLDCSNHAYAAKMIEDALKGYLIVDDSKKYVREITHKFHADKRIGVKIEAIK